MTGIYQHSIDAKGRLIIPAKLREDLGEEFYVTISPERCLRAYSNEGWEKLNEQVKALSRVKQTMMRPLFSRAAKCELDTQGRVLLSQPLRDYADLKKNIAIVGVGGHVEFWDADIWAEVDAIETSPERLAEVFEELDF